MNSSATTGDTETPRPTEPRRATPLAPIVLSIASIVVVVVSAVGTWSILENQQDHFAWRIITSQKPGNSGVGWALEHLNTQGVPLNHIVLEPLEFFQQAHAQDHDLSATGTEAIRLQTYVAQSVLDGIELRHAWLANTNFSHSSLKAADLREAVLKGANFSHAALHAADLRNATLERARLDGSHLDQAKLDDAVMIKATLNAATLAEVSAPRVNLEDASAIKARFDNAKLASANLRRVIAIGAFFDEATMAEVSLDHAQLGGASLEGVDLTGAVLNDTQLIYANLSGADLSAAQIHEADFKGANISGMILGGSKGLEAAHWKGAWAWADETVALVNAQWDDTASSNVWRKVLMVDVAYYKESCRDAWRERVAREARGGEIQIAAVISLYRPPEEATCIVSAHAVIDDS